MSEKYQNYLLPSLVYVLTNIWIILVHSIFWDDWTIYHADESAIMQQFIGNGVIWMGYVHKFLLSTPNPILVYHLLIFIIGLVNVFLFGGLLQKIKLPNDIIQYSSLLFAAYPLGYAHMTMICIPYQIGLLMMLVSTNLFVICKQNFKFIYYVPFFVSMFLASAFLPSTIVMLFGIILVYNLHDVDKKSIRTWPIIWRKFVNLSCDIAYFIPCLIFWVIRSIYFMPTGEYAKDGYNTISIHHILSYPCGLLESISDTIQYQCDMIQGTVSSAILFLFCISIIFAINYVLTEIPQCDSKQKNGKYIIVFSFLYIMGISAYLLVGNVQQHNTMGDRHGILLQTVIPILIPLIVTYVCSNRIKAKLIFCAIIAIFCTCGIHQYFVAIEESQKNDAIIEFFKKNKLDDGNVWIMDDVNPFDCERFYTYAGMYKEATNKQDRCFAANLDGFYTDSVYLTGGYNQRDAQAGPFSNIITIKRNEYQFTKYAFINTKHFYFNKIKYRERIFKMYDISLLINKTEESIK